MIEEDYVSYETAQLLKSKGFDELCYACYEYFKSGVTMYSGWLFEYKGEPVHNTNDRVKCPTLQMAMKWLREIYHIHTEICLYKTNKDDIEPKKSRKAPYYTFRVWDSVTGNNVDKRLTNNFIGDTYEQACEAAILYCLENLI